MYCRIGNRFDVPNPLQFLPVANPEDILLERVEQFGCVAGAVVGLLDDVRARLDELPENVFLPENVEVVLDVRRRRLRREDLMEVFGAADPVEKLGIGQPLRDGDEVDRLVRAVHLQDCFVDGAMGGAVEMIRAGFFRTHMQGFLRGEKRAAQNGNFRLFAERNGATAELTDGGDGHGAAYFEVSLSLEALPLPDFLAVVPRVLAVVSRVFAVVPRVFAVVPRVSKEATSSPPSTLIFTRADTSAWSFTVTSYWPAFRMGDSISICLRSTSKPFSESDLAISCAVMEPNSFFCSPRGACSASVSFSSFLTFSWAAASSARSRSAFLRRRLSIRFFDASSATTARV